jgi:hypothetical protein
MDIAFIYVPGELPGIQQGDPVLILADPAEDERTFAAGACPPLQVIPAADAVPTR